MRLSLLYEAPKPAVDAATKQRVIDLANQGLTNVEIVAATNVHKNHVSKIVKAANLSADVVARRRARFDELKRERVRAQWKNPEYVAAQRAKGLAQWEDPEFREAHRQRGLARAADPEFREFHRAKALAQWEDPEFREAQRQRGLARGDDPEYVEAMRQHTLRQWQERGPFWDWIKTISREKQTKILMYLASLAYPSDDNERVRYYRNLLAKLEQPTS